MLRGAYKRVRELVGVEIKGVSPWCVQFAAGPAKPDCPREDGNEMKSPRVPPGHALRTISIQNGNEYLSLIVATGASPWEKRYIISKSPAGAIE
jgi:hypothetical protein